MDWKEFFKKKTIFLICLIVIATIVLYLSFEWNNANYVKERLNGYKWFWGCKESGADEQYENNLVIWKENITKVERKKGFWLVYAIASKQNDPSNKPDTDEKSRLLLSIDEKTFEVKDVRHEIFTLSNPVIDANGKIVGPTVFYCKFSR